jgi:proton glutamate symport protein
MKFKKIGLIVLVLISIAAILAFLNHYNILAVPPTALLFSRWLAIAALFLLGLKGKP